ncbi:MAG: sugar transferase [Bacteroidetes bacterium]|nr:MAG: sugar transferase [Bacteroidota bacterium]
MLFKRLFDFTASFFGLIIILPFLIIIALFIKLRMPGPVFFIQKRVGKNGELFKMVKFRSMKVSHGGTSITVKGEARITPFGAFLRKYKLDELPELWNILKGDMSIVGPRPDVPGYADLLEGDDRLMLSVRPGLTGAASLCFINEEEILAKQADPENYNDEILFPEKVRINNNYIHKWNMILDVKIILFTMLGKKLKEHWAQNETEKLINKESRTWLKKKK